MKTILTLFFLGSFWRPAFPRVSGTSSSTTWNNAPRQLCERCAVFTSLPTISRCESSMRAHGMEMFEGVPHL
jgi:hypothetical protein